MKKKINRIKINGLCGRLDGRKRCASTKKMKNLIRRRGLGLILKARRLQRNSLHRFSIFLLLFFLCRSDISCCTVRGFEFG